jgi:hypothetical protein
MDTLVHDEVREQIVALADEYATLFIEIMPMATSASELHTALSGTMLVFLADVKGIMSE